MKADVIGIALKVQYKNIDENINHTNDKFGPMVIHDEHRI